MQAYFALSIWLEKKATVTTSSHYKAIHNNFHSIDVVF